VSEWRHAFGVEEREQFIAFERCSPAWCLRKPRGDSQCGICLAWRGGFFAAAKSW
jgi:hypothetical protein